MTLDEFVARLVDREPAASPGEVEVFEAEIGSRLPDDFRRFLSRCDGGHARGTCFVGPKPDGEDIYVAIADVFGLRYGDDRSLRHRLRSPSAGPPGRPPALLPIMEDLGGNLVCLALTGEDRGRVYLFDHERSPDPSEWEDGVGPEAHLERLADSFADFVAGLEPADGDDA